MSDYSKTTNFTAKDALPPGNPAKVVSGVDFDLEFDNVETSNNTKFDLAGSGIANSGTTITLDINELSAVSIVSADQIPFADASDSENPKKITYASLLTALENDLDHDAITGFVADEHIDMSGVTITLGTGLTYGAGGTDLTASSTINLDLANIDHDSLLNFVLGEHVLHSSVTMTAGVALTGGGTIAATRTFDLDITTLGEMTSVPVGTDDFLYADAGVMKKINFNQTRLPSVNDANGHTFVSTDVGQIRYFTGSTATWTMPSAIGQDDCFIIIINSGSGDLTLAGSINTANGLLDIPPNGIVCLIRESSSVWFAAGNLQ